MEAQATFDRPVLRPPEKAMEAPVRRIRPMAGVAAGG